MLPQIAPHVKNQCIVVSVAAGRTIATIEKGFARELKLVRAMPNTPALVGEAMSALCANTRVTEDELAEVRQIFEAFGKAEIVPESLLDAVVGVSGSSPAYVYLFLEAMADAAVAEIRAKRLINLLHRRSAARQGWCLRRADIRES